MRHVRIGLFAALALALAAGCRTSNYPAKVSGKVTYKGGPVKGGDLVFHTAEGGAFRANLDKDGTYVISDLPVGEMTVTVDTESLNPDKKAPAYGGGRGAAMTKERLEAERKAGFGPPSREEQLARYTKIPTKYANAQTSGLKVSVEKGSQTKNFELTD